MTELICSECGKTTIRQNAKEGDLCFQIGSCEGVLKVMKPFQVVGSHTYSSQEFDSLPDAIKEACRAFQAEETTFIFVEDRTKKCPVLAIDPRGLTEFHLRKK